MPPTRPRKNKFSVSIWTLVIIGISFICMAFTFRPQPSSTLKAALDPYKGYLLSPLLKPRVPGTPGSLEARAHIKKHLEQFGWDVQLHNFIADTPRGSIPMANIVAQRRNTGSNKQSRLTIAAHYDSKRLPEGFVGATDSAFPCALLLYLASIKKEPKKDFDLIFFDGEEAIEEWTDKDSIYGAKALASHQEKTRSLPNTLVLIDLIGNKVNAPIPSWFSNTHHLHKELSAINNDLVGGAPHHRYAGVMQDDHIPYLERSVPVLHLIPLQFPDAWHTMKDDADYLDWEAIKDWADLFEKWLYK